ncbi:MAG: hypothetical protein JXB50_01355 [Spirochaetes bacterium]|nr:hypothetical protein [Spirochaetota bacterium]
MIIEIITPHDLTLDNLDIYLKNGWFRFSNSLFKSKFICIDEKISEIINIRLNLNYFCFKKTQKRILSKIEKENFRTIIKKAEITHEKEIIYNKFKRNFKGFVLFSLYNFLYDNPKNPVFNTYEIDVYDNDRLIAFSFFDAGRQSIASLIAVYDPSYKKYSLGTYTILKEIEFCKDNNINYYYPGYILNNNQIFDYKLRIGPCEYLDEDYNWLQYKSQLPESKNIAIIYKKINMISEELIKNKIDYRYYINPFFSLGYTDYYPDKFIKGLFVYLIFTKEEFLNKLVIEYLVETEDFCLSIAYKTKSYEYLKKMQDSSYFERSSTYLNDIYIYYTNIMCSKNIKEIVKKIKTLLKDEHFYIF